MTADSDREPRLPTQKEPALERAVELLLCVADQPAPVSLRELVERTGYSKSTTHRLMARLERMGIVRKDPQSHLYRIGPRLLNLGRRSRVELEPRRVALPIMERLRDACGETVSLHFLDGIYQVAIEKCDSPEEIRTVRSLGWRVPLFKGATSKAILAFLPDDRAKAILEDVGAAAGAPSPEELALVRARGYAISFGEVTVGATAMSAPVFDYRGVWGGLSISGPTFRFTSALAQQFAPLLMQAAAHLSHELGCQGDGER